MGSDRYRICDVEEIVSGMDFMDMPDDLVETEVGIRLVASGWCVRVEDLGLYLQQGIACAWDEGAGIFLPESDVTVISEGDPKAQEWVWYVQAGFADALALWLEGRMESGQAGQLWCRIILPKARQTVEESEE